ncbi:SDR family oxidoreductase [Nocardia pseudovaccinii]|uniref:SDR family oxidoreductase n=1 Tax=Nocardia pseudovaccinii TaxID=189540 RepID=UPI003D8E4C96
MVTGAGQGIGRAVALRYAAEGAKVAVVDLNAATSESVAREIDDAGGTAIAVACDVGNREEVFAAARRAGAELGPISILVSNAGVTRPALLWKMTDEQWDTVLRVHLTGSFYWLQAVSAQMRENRHGNIIFTTSDAGIVGTVGQINYAAAKAGLLGMTRAAARELAPYDIVVNAVAPSAATAMTETIRTDPRFKDKYLDEFLLKRWAEPEEIASVYAFLASSEANFLTGQTFAPGGGRVMVR